MAWAMCLEHRRGRRVAASALFARPSVAVVMLCQRQHSQRFGIPGPAAPVDEAALMRCELRVVPGQEALGMQRVCEI